MGGEGESIYQQDNARCHTANIVKQWSNDNNVHVPRWSDNSRDMNPNEQMLDDIEDVIFKYTTELSEGIKLEWDSIHIEC